VAFIGLIPARGGSKGIPGKNLALCGGKPLLAWTAEAALTSGVLDRVILSTDDEKIAEAGRKLGLDAPFLRPPALAADDTPMLSVMAHALEFLRTKGADIDALVLLQPTSPFRRAHHILHSVELFRARSAATVVSVVRVPHCFVPSSLMRSEAGRLAPYLNGEIGPIRRQDKATLFARNGPAVLIVRPSEIDAGRLYGEPTVGYEMGEIDSLDIDTPENLRLADHLMRTGWQ
jgi:CMP-N-acetylneuraminic acid synthetase